MTRPLRDPGVPNQRLYIGQNACHRHAQLLEAADDILARQRPAVEEMPLHPIGETSLEPIVGQKLLVKNPHGLNVPAARWRLEPAVDI